MISGFNNVSSSSTQPHHQHLSSNFPIPFNLPNVLHKFLYEDIDLQLDNKQTDIQTALRVSYEALQKTLEIYAQKEHEYKNNLLEKPNDKESIEKIEDIGLERMNAIQDFKYLLEAMSEALTKEQYGKLLKASNLPV
ncbi:MAG: hypothetical protein ABXS93_06485 [Sulfurimonas sp.]